MIKLTPVAKQSLLHVARATLAGEWARAVVRRAWRGREGEADAAYEYQLTPAMLAQLNTTRKGDGARSGSGT